MVIPLIYSVAGGMLVMLATARLDQIAWRFLRLVGVIVLAVIVGAIAWSVRTGGAFAGDWRNSCAALAAAMAMTVVFLAPVAANRAVLFSTTGAIGGSAGLAAAAGFALANVGAGRSGTAAAIAILGQVLSGLFLGSITVSWLLGHAYLTATRMTIAPLRHFTTLLVWAVAARAGFVAFSMIAAWFALGTSMRSPGRPVLIDLMYGSWLILFLRIGVGLLAVGVFAWMVRDCVRIRSTQSATGILYFGSLFAYVGELAAWQLSQQWGWPV